MSCYVIGLTGGIACGKSNLSAALRSEGAYTVDADAVSRELTAEGGPALPLLRQAFGDGVFSGDTLDRAALGELVFSDAEALNRLNELLHPLILRLCRERLDACPGVAVLEAPLLFECGLEKDCDEVWCAYIPQKEQLKRLRERSGLTCRQAMERIRSQMPAREKARRADRVIRTDGSREQSAELARRMYRETLFQLGM